MTYDAVIDKVRKIPADILPDVIHLIDAFVPHEESGVQKDAKGVARFRTLRGKIQFADDYDYKAMRLNSDIS